MRLPVDRRRTSRAFRLYLLQQRNGPGKRDYRVLLARRSLLLADRSLVHSGSGAVRGGVAVDVADHTGAAGGPEGDPAGAGPGQRN